MRAGAWWSCCPWWWWWWWRPWWGWDTPTVTYPQGIKGVVLVLSESLGELSGVVVHHRSLDLSCQLRRHCGLVVDHDVWQVSHVPAFDMSNEHASDGASDREGGLGSSVSAHHGKRSAYIRIDTAL